MVLIIQAVEAYPKESSSIQGYQCTLCEALVPEIQPLLTPENINKIKEIGQHTCASVGPEAHDFCVQWFDAIIKGLNKISVETPNEICKQLGLCKGSTSPQCPFKELAEVYKHNSIPCVMIVDEIKYLLRNNQTIEGIENAIDSICVYISKNDDKKYEECHQISVAYVKEAIKFVLEQNSQDLCSILSLRDTLMKMAPETLCNGCLSTVRTLKQLVLKPEVDAKIKRVVHYYCVYFNQGDEQKCFQDKYSDIKSFVDDFVKAKDHDICQKFKLCDQ